MEFSKSLLSELQKRLKIGNRKGVHLNAIPGKSRYKFDINRLKHIDPNLPTNFVNELLSERKLKFKITWKDNVQDLAQISEDEQIPLARITRSLEDLINQTETIESEKGINTFGFGFPVLVRRDKADNQLTVAPILIWSLRANRTREFNTWEISRTEEDPIYVNEILINHLENDSKVAIEQISSEMLDDGLINRDELVQVCAKMLRDLNPTVSPEVESKLKQSLGNIASLGDKHFFDKLLNGSKDSVIHFGGLFSIFEVQKQNIITDYNLLLQKGNVVFSESDIDEPFQSISSVETDPSQQAILRLLGSKRNLMIQGPPGTGKSQTLTAVLINALENHKRSIVVCEKQTALEVLHKALIDKGLEKHCILLKDIFKDRRSAVDSVRDRVDHTSYSHTSFFYAKQSLDQIIQTVRQLISSINSKHRKIDERYLNNQNWTDLVGEQLRQLKIAPDNARIILNPSHLTFTLAEFNHLLGVVEQGESLYSTYRSYEALQFINPAKFSGDNPFLIERQLENDFRYYKVEIDNIKAIINNNHKEYIALRNEQLSRQVSEVNDIIYSLNEKEKELIRFTELAEVQYRSLRKVEWEEQKQQLEATITQLDGILTKNLTLDVFSDERKINGIIFKVKCAFSHNLKQVSKDHRSAIQLFQILNHTITKCKDVKFNLFAGNMKAKIDQLQNLKQHVAVVTCNIDKTIHDEFDSLGLREVKDDYGSTALEQLLRLISSDDNSNNLEAFFRATEAEVEHFKNWYETKFQKLAQTLTKCRDLSLAFPLPQSIQEGLNKLATVEMQINTIRVEFKEKIENEFSKLDLYRTNAAEVQLQSLTILQAKVNSLVQKISDDNWTLRSIPTTNLQSILSSIDLLVKAKDDHFNQKEDVFSIEFKWFHYFNSLRDNIVNIVVQLKRYDNWKRVFITSYLHELLSTKADTNLPTDDTEQEKLGDHLPKIKKEQLNYIRMYWKAQEEFEARRFNDSNYDFTVQNLYNKRSTARHKRLSLRQIVLKDSELFTSYFPVILTTPDVCSTLFPGVIDYFDLVLFDEGSQLRLEDNLPALLKGKQVIIAGDEHQMPPSNYFSKVFDGSIEDEEDAEEDDQQTNRTLMNESLLACESLLEFGAELRFEKMFLDFHYRSKHPYLIDFSNNAFYKQRLKPLPNRIDYNPITYVQVDGTFSEHTNDAEAEVVLSILENNIQRLPNGEYPSVGIATFNITQRNLIKRKILERQRFPKYEDFNEKIQELEANGLFVKNLENIQGDERDVIIISCTYGVNKDGKFSRAFGPINHQKGYKLLNVIITRAKYKVYVCSSIPIEEILSYKDHLEVEGNNKKAVFYAYLQYARTIHDRDNQGRLDVLTTLQAHSPSDLGIGVFDPGLESPFEEEVYYRLAEHFGERKVKHQVKFAGFRIDLVYESDIPNTPRIAIECDGAKYHSSEEAYLHDRHRQKILESQGFVFHRIWSTNWWRNPNRELQKLLTFISEKEKAANLANQIDDFTSAFTDTVQYSRAKQTTAKTEQVNQKDLFSYYEEDESTLQIRNLGIKLNSKVKVKYLNTGKDVTVQLIESKADTKQIRDGIQKIYYKSPLGESILGRSVGDVVRVGALDHFVEILDFD